MTVRLLFAGLLLMAVPCASSQTAPETGSAPPGAMAGPTMPRSHGGRDDGARGTHEDGLPGGEMHGPGRHLLPPGTWWRNPEVIAKLSLSADQQKHIDEIFLQSRVQLIHMHASLEEEQLLLEPLLNANPVDQGKALAQIGKIADTRADLEKADAKMLLGIRAVLNADQWTRLQAERAAHRARGGDMGGPGGGRGPTHGRGGMQPPSAP